MDEWTKPGKKYNKKVRPYGRGKRNLYAEWEVQGKFTQGKRSGASVSVKREGWKKKGELEPWKWSSNHVINK